MESAKKIETLRVNIWRMDKKIDDLKNQVELMKYQIIELESIENKDRNSGVEAAIDPQRILTRRGSKSRRLALAKANEIDKK